MERNQFTWYRSYYEAMKTLSPEDFKAAVLAICDYALREDVSKIQNLPDKVNGLLIPLIPTIDLDRRLSAEGRRSAEYKAWRTAVFVRDDYTCQDCGGRGIKINAHHIKPYAYYIEERYAVSNGITLCVPCHKARHKRRA